jgi:putative addiction module component (TIGR02574 family)
MSVSAPYIDQILRLSVDERIRLVQQIWDSIAAESEPPPLSDAQLSEIERRIAAHKRDPSTAIPWEDALSRLRERYG